MERVECFALFVAVGKRKISKPLCYEWPVTDQSAQLETLMFISFPRIGAQACTQCCAALTFFDRQIYEIGQHHNHKIQQANKTVQNKTIQNKTTMTDAQPGVWLPHLSTGGLGHPLPKIGVLSILVFFRGLNVHGYFFRFPERYFQCL